MNLFHEWVGDGRGRRRRRRSTGTRPLVSLSGRFRSEPNPIRVHLVSVGIWHPLVCCAMIAVVRIQ